MKKLIFALTVMSSGALLAQDLTGTWQGTLQARGRDLRTVIKISKADGSGLKAVLYSIDQGGQGLAASTITLQGSAVKLSIPGIGGTYEGKLNTDGNSMVGTWSQGPMPLPLNLRRVNDEAAWEIPASPAPVKPMAADANPAFEVATIKPSNPATPGKNFMVRGRQLSTLNTTLSDLITFAYGIHPRQVTNGPAWLETEKFDLLAKPDGDGQPNDKQWKSMIQKLLADRFKLAFHRDKKELSVYAIVVGKNGPRLTKSEGSPDGLPGLFFRGRTLPARNASMGDLANLLQSVVLDRPVVDHTGLSGKFDFTLSWTPDEFQFASLPNRPVPPPENTAAAPDLFTAFQDQLGLKLESTKAATEVFVVERVEKPSEN